MYRLRGHHLLCLLGYRGMGYSDEFVKQMTNLHSALRENSSTEIELVEGPDDLCAKFPDDKPCHCLEQTVMKRDAVILERLGLQVGEVVSWGEIETRIAYTIWPSDVPSFCATCPWLSYGVCEEGVARIQNGQGLYPVSTS
ncbi:DUF1284 domain-containing protein [Alicyclobacillus dauci]|uniref:DUF1284 domain-containing protein n=1 Tax=Alicyclobacillus dauci TaxID=1475485 RepID=A0ABY6YZS9_9BACL|nr:DUF1284 domain-containing protein [Alicyclobacillus dauci]WAH36092.1 DUF1284 domain-containing protein [Alicyclobacillus dauci]